MNCGKIATSSKRKEIVLELPKSLLNKVNGFSIDFGLYIAVFSILEFFTKAGGGFPKSAWEANRPGFKKSGNQ